MKKNPKFCFLSSLQPEAIKKIVFRLENPWIPIFNHNIVCGKFYGNNKFQLYYPSFSRNSWEPTFYGTISEHLNGTIITGCFQIALSVRIFVWVLRISSILLVIFKLIDILPNNIVIVNPPKFIIVFLLSFVIEWIGIVTGDPGKKKVLQFIEKELCAAPYADTKDGLKENALSR